MSDAMHTPWKTEIDDLSGSLLIVDADNKTVAEVFDRNRVDVAILLAAAPESLFWLKEFVALESAAQCLVTPERRTAILANAKHIIAAAEVKGSPP